MNKSAETLAVTRHSIQRLIERTDCETEEEAIRYARHQYATAKIVYKSHRYPDQLKIQNDDIVLCYNEEQHVVITVFISGHVSVREFLEA
tara:strand:- start:1940 stop:2209 length:270 start_codon:yes stop_codon:yes gene_type:complete